MLRRHFAYTALIGALLAAVSPSAIRQAAQLPHRAENETSFWIDEAQQFVGQQLNAAPNTNRARNAVLFVGAGMSMTTMAATRLHIGSVDTVMSFERFPGVAMLRTYCVDGQVPDSACAATALYSGAKSNVGTLGVNGHVQRADCRLPADDQRIVGLAEDALNAGKAVGIVTNGRLTDATVAAIYAHSADARWRTNVQVREAGCNGLTVPDIATQLVHGTVGSRLRVILGGGRSDMRSTWEADERPGAGNGHRDDGRNLIREWLAGKQGANATYASDAQQLDAIDASETDYLLGMFNANALPDNLSQLQSGEGSADTPSLEQMTGKALEVLRRNANGFLLFVVNAHIESGHQRNWARVAVDETAVLDRTVAAAQRLLADSLNETMLVVTADHSHTLTYTGYALRDNDIFEMADDGFWVGDNMPVMTLSYAAGPGYRNNLRQDLPRRERIDPTTLTERTQRTFEFPATMRAESDLNAGDDVAVFASGPWSHLIGGSPEQSFLAHAMRFAMCIGPNAAAFSACNLPAV